MGRRKGNSAFPVARIKKMMQSDDDVGKIATVTPVLVAKALECMMEHVLTEAADVARRRQTKTVTPQHLKYCVSDNDHFDFLRPTLAHIAPLEDHPAPSGQSAPSTRRSRPKRPRSPVAPQPSASPSNQSSTPDSETPSARVSARRLPAEVPAPGKRHKPPGPNQPSVSAPQLPNLVNAAQSAADPAADDDDDNYDDDDDDEGLDVESASRSASALLPSHPLPAVQHPAIAENDDSKASERVSVHALVS